MDGEVVYESPDGGKTVYRRKVGTNDRVLIKGGNPIYTTTDLWRDMAITAIDDPILKELMDKAEIYYKLKHG